MEDTRRDQMTPDWIDFSHQVKIHQNSKVRLALILGGSISLSLGIIGIFVPVLPTTPFLLLSSLCYAKSSVRFYNYLLNNRVFGKYIQDWRNKGSISIKTKFFALTMLSLTIGSSVVFFIPIFPIKIIVAFIGVAVSIYLIRLPTHS